MALRNPGWRRASLPAIATGRSPIRGSDRDPRVNLQAEFGSRLAGLAPAPTGAPHVAQAMTSARRHDGTGPGYRLLAFYPDFCFMSEAFHGIHHLRFARL